MGCTIIIKLINTIILIWKILEKNMLLFYILHLACSLPTQKRFFCQWDKPQIQIAQLIPTDRLQKKDTLILLAKHCKLWKIVYAYI